MKQNSSIKKILLIVIIVLLAGSLLTYYKIKNQADTVPINNETLFILPDGVYKNTQGNMVNLIKTSNTDGVSIYFLSSPDLSITETEFYPKDGKFISTDGTLTITSTQTDTISMTQNGTEVFTGGLSVSPREETFKSTGSIDFTWIVRQNEENSFNLILKKGDTETEIAKNANDCVAVNMFDAPAKPVKNLQYPTMKCAMKTTVEFFGAYKQDPGIIVKRITADGCDEYGSCDLKKESKGIIIE